MLSRLFIILFLSSVLYSQDALTAIRVNNYTISIDEFKNRLNNLPQRAAEAAEVKEDLICTLIAEAILADYHKQSSPADQKTALLKEQYHKEALYEQWMDEEVRSGIKITEDEIRKAYPHFRVQKIVDFWILAGKPEAEKLRTSILKKEKPARDPQVKVLEYGESLPEIEEAVFNLKNGEVTQPLQVDSLFYLFRLKETKDHPDHSKYNYQYWKPSVEKQLRLRKEKAALDSRLSILMKGKEFTINREAYNFLHDRLYPIIYGKNNPDALSPEIIQYEISSENSNDRLFNKVLINFNDGSEWSIGVFWKKLAVSPFPLNYKNPLDLKPGLRDVIQRTILLETVAEDAAAKGYNSKTYARNEYEMWSRNADASAYLEAERNSIVNTEAELIEYYDANKQNFMRPELFKIIPVIVKNEELAREVNRQAREGSDFIALAEKYSITKHGLNPANPGIFITKDSWGEIGKILPSLKVGEISPVIKMDDTTFAFVRLLEIQKSAPYAFDEIKGRLSSLKSDIKLQAAVSSYLEKVIDNYKIEINRKAIDKVEYYGGNMIVKKTHFPLRSAAPGFPLFNHRSKWYQKL